MDSYNLIKADEITPNDQIINETGFLGIYKNFSLSIFETFESVFKNLILPFYFEVKNNIWLNMAFMMILVYQIINSIGKLSKRSNSKVIFINFIRRILNFL